MAKVNFEQSFENLKKIIKLMKSEGIDFDSDHWLAKDKKSATRIRKELSLFAPNPLYVRRQSRRLEQKPCCENPLCCDPDHLSVVFKNAHKTVGMSQEDFNELMEELDFDEIEKLGYEEYLRKFNSELPESLKITLTTLLTAVNIHKKTVGEK